MIFYFILFCSVIILNGSCWCMYSLYVWMNRVRGVFRVTLALQEREVLREGWGFQDLRETRDLKANMWVLHPDKTINWELHPAYKRSFCNKTVILISDLGWHRGARLSRGTRNVWTEGEFYHTLPGVWIKCFFLLKNRNVIVHVCLPKRNKQRWDLSFLKEFFPLGNTFSSTHSERHNSHKHWCIFVKVFSETQSRELIKQDKHV